MGEYALKSKKTSEIVDETIYRSRIEAEQAIINSSGVYPGEITDGENKGKWMIIFLDDRTPASTDVYPTSDRARAEILHRSDVTIEVLDGRETVEVICSSCGQFVATTEGANASCICGNTVRG